MAVQQQGFPNVSSPFVGPQRYIEQAWLQFLINLWKRTGATQGGSLFNSGDVKESAAPGTQDGWLECDGAAVSRSTYSLLFAAINTIYGAGDGFSTFNLPDYRGRFRIGTSGSYPLGTTGGATTQALVINNLPSHNHGISDPGHPHTINTSSGAGSSNTDVVRGNGTSVIVESGIVNSNTTGITTVNTGLGTSFSIMPPYTPITVLIKI